MYHIFFICSVKGHLGCFENLAVTNRAAMKMLEQVSLWWDEGSFGICPRVVELDLEVIDSHVSEKRPCWFPQGLSIAFPLAMYECSSYSTSLPAGTVTCFVDLFILTGVRWHPNVIFIFILLMGKCVGCLSTSQTSEFPLLRIFLFRFVQHLVVICFVCLFVFWYLVS